MKKILENLPKTDEEEDLVGRLKKLAFNEEEIEILDLEDGNLEDINEFGEQELKDKERRTTLYLIEEFRCEDCLKDDFL